MSPKQILIATPTHRGEVRREYALSLLQLTEALRERSIGHEFCIEGCAVLHDTRNLMASRVFFSRELTHLLFVDDDLAFEPPAVLKLIEADRDVIGCAYPSRDLPMNNPLAPVSEIMTLGEWLSQHNRYVIGETSGEINNGIVEVSRIGSGLLLISKAALVKLVQEQTVSTYTCDGHVHWFSEENYYGFFDYMTIKQHCLSEDFSFCERWRKVGGKIYAVVSETITHVGDVAVQGRYVDFFGPTS